MASADEIGDDVPDGVDFFARRMALPVPRPKVLEAVDRVVLVHRLREVMALVGFTRFEAEMPDIDGELALDVQAGGICRGRCPGCRPSRTGARAFFIAFKKTAIDEWLAGPR